MTSTESLNLGTDARDVTSEFPDISSNLIMSGFPVSVHVRFIEVMNGTRKQTFAFIVPNDFPLSSSSVSQASHQLNPKLAPPERKKKCVNPYQFRCFSCSKYFSTRHMLKRHEAIHINGPFCCPDMDCGATFRNKATLTKHCIAEHGLKLKAHQAQKKKKKNNIKICKVPTLLILKKE